MVAPARKSGRIDLSPRPPTAIGCPGCESSCCFRTGRWPLHICRWPGLRAGIWLAELERYEPQRAKLLIGHSGGAGFLLRWCSEHPAWRGRLVVVAPWLDPAREEAPPDFFDIQWERISPALQVEMLRSGQDPEAGCEESAQIIHHHLPWLTEHLVPGGGHLVEGHLGSRELPALAELLGLH